MADGRPALVLLTTIAMAIWISLSRVIWIGTSARTSAAAAKVRLQAYCHPNEFGPVTHLLYRGLGGCRFEDVSEKAGIAKAPGKGLGVAFQDVDRDGWPDIFVANDSFPQQLFRNKRDGTFEEIALAMGAAYDEDGKVFAGMGVDLADYDNDGLPDVFVNALANQGYGLFRNSKGLLEYVSGPSGLTASLRCIPAGARDFWITTTMAGRISLSHKGT